jgi:hypothetical protein
MKYSLLLIVIGTLLFTGCSSVPTKDIYIETETNPKANLDAYKTYSWLAAAAILNDPQGLWEPPAFDADTEIKFLIDRELREKGIMHNSANPDMLVAFAIGVDMAALEIKTDPKTDMTVLEDAPTGGLLLIFIDPSSGYAVWAGAATADVLENPDTETVKARLDYVVTNMLKDLK